MCGDTVPLGPFLMSQQLLLSGKVLCHISGRTSILKEKGNLTHMADGKVKLTIVISYLTHVASAIVLYCCC